MSVSGGQKCQWKLLTTDHTPTTVICQYLWYEHVTASPSNDPWSKSDGYCANHFQSVTTWTLQSFRCFELITLKLFMIVCGVLVQEDSPNVCFRITNCWQQNISNLTAMFDDFLTIEKFNFDLYSPNVNVSWSCRREVTIALSWFG